MSYLIKIMSLLFLWNISIYANEYAIVSSSFTQELTQSQARAIFLKKIIFIDDMKMLPVNLGARDKIRNSFESHILEMSFSHLKAYWTKQHYLGHRAPISMKSQKSMKAFVIKVEGAIGYIEMKNIKKPLNILYKWSD